MSSGLYLTNPAPDYSLNRGHFARQESGFGFPSSQQWSEHVDGDGLRLDSWVGGDVLDLRSSSMTPGANILAYPDNGAGSKNQRWELVDEPWL